MGRLGFLDRVVEQGSPVAKHVFGLQRRKRVLGKQLKLVDDGCRPLVHRTLEAQVEEDDGVERF